VHRIGRTGRAGASGIAISFASGKDGINLKKIERFTGQQIASHVVPGLEPRFKSYTGSNNKSRGAPGITHKRNRSWSNDGNKSNLSSVNGNRGNNRNRSLRGESRGNSLRGNSPSPYARTK